nr:hypothetical protein [Candidatus Woesearchaeota archaeon]
MPIVGFNFERILAEKKSPINKELRIKPNVVIKDVKIEEANLGGDKKQKLLKILFEYQADYQPKIGNIEISGNLLYTGPQKEIEKIVDKWKKDKKMNDDIILQFLNTVLLRCNIKALSLSQEVNLPPQLRLPTINKKVDPKDYIG